MTDLVERLRRMAPHPIAYGGHEAAAKNKAERHEAADEIERLRAALGHISRMSGHPDKVVCLATISAAKGIAEKALTGRDSDPAGIADLKAEATKLLPRVRGTQDDEHAIAVLHTALVLAFKWGQENDATECTHPNQLMSAQSGSTDFHWWCRDCGRSGTRAFEKRAEEAEIERLTNGVKKIQGYLEENRTGDALFVCDALLAEVVVTEG